MNHTELEDYVNITSRNLLALMLANDAPPASAEPIDIFRPWTIQDRIGALVLHAYCWFLLSVCSLQPLALSRFIILLFAVPLTVSLAMREVIEISRAIRRIVRGDQE